MVDQATEPDRSPSLARASGTMAIATVVSRVSGLVSKVFLAAVVGLGVVNDSYTVANTLPTVVNELLLGGVLTSIAVPLLVRAQQQSREEGERYAQWMITMGAVLLVIATATSVAAAPLLTELYLGSDTRANAALTTAFAYLLLPGIVFYGLSALLAAILNTRERFAAPAWAPVVNNCVVIATIAVYAMVPGEISTSPVRMGEAKVLILAVGTVLGIACQSLVVVAALRHAGFRFRWRWGWDHRLREFGALGFWVVLYTAISQIGMIVAIRVTGQGTEGSVATFTYAWLLSQVPYGVLGVSLLTALMPRISRAAGGGDTEGFVAYLSLGTRMSGVMLMPLSALMVIAGGPIGIALFSLGETSLAAADRLGTTLAFSAMGIGPFAVTMLQLRAFYAMKDARTPAVINAVMVVFRAGLCYVALAALAPEDVVAGVAFAMSLSFLLGAAVGQVWLHVKVGPQRSWRAFTSLLRAAVATAIACVAAVATASGLLAVVGPLGPTATAWLTLVVESVVVLGLAFGLLVLFRAPELAPAVTRLRHLLSR